MLAKLIQEIVQVQEEMKELPQVVHTIYKVNVRVQVPEVVWE
jgi:hypothetical protein